MAPRPRSIALITGAVLIIASYTHEIISRAPQYRWLHSHRPFYVAESLDKIGGAAVCVLAVWLMYRSGLRGISRELGLSAPVFPAIAFALVASSPMLIGFAITRSLTPHIEILPLLFLTVFSPLVEEIEFRGCDLGFGHGPLAYRQSLELWKEVKEDVFQLHGGMDRRRRIGTRDSHTHESLLSHMARKCS